VAKFVGQVKAVASTKFNKSGVSDVPFFWQAEYGALSFDAKRLPNYIAYVDRQKEHHSSGNTIPILERLGGNGPQIISESRSAYETGAENWWQEMLTL
jgi:hypothetical protein